MRSLIEWLMDLPTGSAVALLAIGTVVAGFLLEIGDDLAYRMMCAILDGPEGE